MVKDRTEFENMEDILRAALAYVDENWVPEPYEPGSVECDICYDSIVELDAFEKRVCYSSKPKDAPKKSRRKKQAIDQYFDEPDDESFADGCMPSAEPEMPLPSMPAPMVAGKKSRYGDRYDAKQISAMMDDRMTDGYMAGVQQELNQAVDLTFSEKLATVISERDLRDVDVYKAAHIDRKLFSKIINDRNYAPSRDTVLALSFGLNMGLEETNDMLQRAGFAISHSSRRDVLIEYFLRAGIHNMDLINRTLYETGEKIIGK